MSSHPTQVRVIGPAPAVEALVFRLRSAGLAPAEAGEAVVLFVGPAKQAPPRGDAALVVLHPFGDEEARRLAAGEIDEVIPPAADDAELAARLRAAALRHQPAPGQETRELIDHLSDGAVLLDSQGRVLQLNAAGAEILGVDPVQASGRPFLEVAPPVDTMAAGVLVRAIRSGGRVLDADLEVTLPGRGRAVLAVGAGQLGDGTGRAVLSFRDVTENRATFLKLRQTRDFLECLLDSSTDAVIAADLKGRIIVFNRAAEQLFGLPAAEARRRLTVVDLYPSGGARQVMRLLRDSPRRQIDSVRTYGQTHKGDLIPIELSAALVRVDGKEVASVGLMRDLRERVRVESELSRALSRLGEAEKQAAVTALAGATAHELNQPLTVILGFVELLQRKADDRVRGPLDAINRETERMVQIVRRIAKLTRLETQAYPGDRQIADLEKSSGPQVVQRK